MKLTSRPKLKRVWIALVTLVGLIAVVGTSYAAYISQDAQRGVARNRDTDRIRFSSNYLQPQPSSVTSETQYVSKVIAYSKNTAADIDLPIDIYIYNYIQGSTSLVNDKDVTYTMTIKIKNGTQESYEVKYADETLTQTEDADGMYYFTKENVTLPGRAQSLHHYTVTVKGADLDKIKIFAKADPVNKSYTGNQFLAATISPCTASEIPSFSCDGTFTDSANGTPKNYDAFNYEVSISGGSANVTLTWDAAKVEIDPYFLEKIEKSKNDIKTDGSKKSITFTMDQDKGTGEYLIPFYRLCITDDLPESWADMDSVIEVSGTQSTTTDDQTETTN